MGYPKDLLNDNEEIVLDRNPHWSFLLGPVAMISMSVVVLVAILSIRAEFYWMGLIILCLALVGSLGRFMRWKTTEFVVTTDRVIFRQGIVAKSGIEIPLDRIVNISFHQSFWERLLGAGDLVMESAAEQGRQPFTDIANPSFVQNLIYRQMESLEVRDARRQAGYTNEAGQPARPVSIPEQIEKLDELRQRGIVSDEEFRLKKAQLLERM